MIEYKTTLDNIKASNLGEGFFEGWLKKPSPETHYKILKNSYKIAIAVSMMIRNYDKQSGKKS